jgi:hypothetical protein
MDQFKLNPVQYLGSRKLTTGGNACKSGYNGDFSVNGLKLYRHVGAASITPYSLNESPVEYSFGLGAGADGYYLPYSGDAAYMLQLGASAEYFLTPRINGCCFIASGSADKPVVIHANCNKDVGDSDSADVRVAKYKKAYLNFTSDLLKKGYISDSDPTVIFDPEMYEGCGSVTVFGVRRASDWTIYATLNRTGGGKTLEIWPNVPKGIPD